MRKLVTIKQIESLLPIEGADAIELAVIGGWKVVVKKGEFAEGDQCVYFEIDSFLPESDSRYSFLMKSGVREFEGVRGHKLRTIKLRGQISQGLALPTSAFPELTADTEDAAAILGVLKWEPVIAAQIAGQCKGSFPSFIQKTDQERCQNLKGEIFGYEDQLYAIDTASMPALIVSAMIGRGEIVEVGGQHHKVIKAKASPDDLYEVTVKLDGSSCTLYHNNGSFGVCSRNLELKMNDENSGNAMVQAFTPQIQERLRSAGRNYAFQGEIMGPGIQGNRENLKKPELFFYDVFDIDAGEYVSPSERMRLLDGFNHVPVLHQSVTLSEIGIKDMESLLKFAEGPSLNHPVREGVVFKRVDGKFSFKAISNVFLAKEKD